MILNGFTVQITQDDIPLLEYSESARESAKTTTGPSHYYKEQQRTFRHSDRNFYAAIRSDDSRFAVQVSARCATAEKPIMAIVYVNGQLDYTHLALQGPGMQEKDGVWDHARMKKFFYRFGKTSTTSAATSIQSFSDTGPSGSKKRKFSDEISSDEEDGLILPAPSTYTKGKKSSESPPATEPSSWLGAVSVRFYRAAFTEKEVSVPSFDISQVSAHSTPFSKTTDGTTTTFDSNDFKKISNSQPTKCLLEPLDDFPVAELHLHYRQSSWLRGRNLVMISTLIRLQPKQQLPVSRAEQILSINNSTSNVPKSKPRHSQSTDVAGIIVIDSEAENDQQDKGDSIKRNPEVDSEAENDQQDKGDSIKRNSEVDSEAENDQQDKGDSIKRNSEELRDELNAESSLTSKTKEFNGATNVAISGTKMTGKSDDGLKRIIESFDNANEESTSTVVGDTKAISSNAFSTKSFGARNSIRNFGVNSSKPPTNDGGYTNFDDDNFDYVSRPPPKKYQPVEQGEGYVSTDDDCYGDTEDVREF